MGRKHNLGRYLLGSSVIALVAASGSSASADTNEQLAAQLKAMQAQIEHLQRQIEQNNQRQIEQNNSAAAAARSAAARSEAAQAAAADSAAAAQAAASKGGGEKEKDDLDLKVKWKGAPELSSKDGKFRMKVRGRLRFDYNGINQDQASPAFPTSTLRDPPRASWRRRHGMEGRRLQVRGRLRQRHTAIKDARLRIHRLGTGVQNPRRQLQDVQLARTHHERQLHRVHGARSFVDAAGFGLDRQIGLGALYQREHFTLAAGVFGPHPFEEERWFQDVKTGSARVTAAPINARRRRCCTLAPAGVRATGQQIRVPEPSLPPTSSSLYGARGADLHLASRFVATPALFDRDTFYGLEAAYVWGPWSIQGEYGQLQANIDSVSSATTPPIGATTSKQAGSSRRDPPLQVWRVYAPESPQPRLRGWTRRLAAPCADTTFST